jgi:hypothetical protein
MRNVVGPTEILLPLKRPPTGLNTLSVAEESLTVYERTEPSDQRHRPEYKRSIARYGVNNRKWIS